ncbi:mitochondrial import receptor subunit TOM22 homolog [Limulus polyphemus]|uniref:Mitochondrial import receptor subunit TOM22 homolog n=1 Tax=Limulus polyphemus TaxID=6850 RepID=A0ABM1BMD3_LIMPO|nr:mitochondrial import receptor subunit TOM22 homolog [Limulus polyphemus]XP_013784930.1 mitochondrial import receptor subunit TOM22 homolog [Limulus polyphemus]XP_022253129.1 mitochondrial import receptor subunit TOM22 homolog [Limulus polyphemus]XP_022253130.1 mitochondrial import receptor subunit TOM22 homolog [Limulus polyphemus]
MGSEESESGFEMMSAPESREESPQITKAEKKSSIKTSSVVPYGESCGFLKKDEEDLDETLGERLWALTEMFPESLRNATSSLITGSAISVKWAYGFSRSVFWIVFSSSVILMAPVMFESERMQLEEMQKQQQRQILLGPSAAVSSGSGLQGMGMMIPGQPQHQ